MHTTGGIAHPDLAAARAILPDVIELRRRLHRIPEVGLELPKTQAIVLDAVRALGLEPMAGVSVGSVVATIEGAGQGPTILLRADMDGLPLTEETGLDFASEHDGRMHACGHDTHVAMLLGASRILVEERATWPGRVLLMFQPGEEGFHGARYMLDEGLLDRSGGERPSGALALHISTLYETGTIDVRPGPMLASGDTLRITVRGRGGHASAPHTAVDPIAVAAELVLALQMMVTRRVDAFDPAVITIAQVIAGTTTNIIPETAFLGGTMRTVSEARRAAVRDGIRQVCAGIAAAHGATIEVEIEAGYPVTVNDDAFSELILSVAGEVLGEENARLLSAPIMGSEDFSYVLQQVPGAMAFVGARPAEVDPATAPMNHSNRVVFDESAMAAGIATYVAVAKRHLSGA
ncbi:MAG: M20 family metallopeptidase [Chloroflexota bacterium]